MLRRLVNTDAQSVTAVVYQGLTSLDTWEVAKEDSFLQRDATDNCNTRKQESINII